MIKILLADDHTIVRDGLRALLECESDFAVVGSVANGVEAVKQAQELFPDVIVLDIAMPELNGIEALAQIKHNRPGSQVVILSVHHTSEHIFQAFRAGASGYLLKESAGTELVAAIRAVHNRQRYLTQRIANILLDDYLVQGSENKGGGLLSSLSQREKEVLALVAKGQSSAEIGARLFLSPRTVETYRLRITRKLGIRDLPGLIKFAIEHGLVE